jgi:hypothetical protein
MSQHVEPAVRFSWPAAGAALAAGLVGLWLAPPARRPARARGSSDDRTT